MDKPICVGFAIFELSKLHMYETNYDDLPTSFGQENLQLHYKDTDGLVISINTKNIINDLKNLEENFDFNNLNENSQL